MSAVGSGSGAGDFRTPADPLVVPRRPAPQGDPDGVQPFAPSTDRTGETAAWCPVSPALLRTAGLPHALWQAGGSPALFARAAEVDAAQEVHAQDARALAEDLGRQVVPWPGLEAADRRAVLAVRRRLHRGQPPTAADCALLHRLPPAADGLSGRADRLHRDAARTCEAAAALEREAEREHVRILAAGWRLAQDEPVVRALVESAAPGTGEEIARRLRDGERWSSKRLRQRGEYVWRLVARAAAKTTPRGWLGHVAALPLASERIGGSPGPSADGGREERPEQDSGRDGARPPGPEDRSDSAVPVQGHGRHGERVREEDRGLAGPGLLSPDTALRDFATETTENVHRMQTRLDGLDLAGADPRTLLAATPLHVRTPESVRCWTAEPEKNSKVRETALRRTPLLDAIWGRLAAGPISLESLHRALLPVAESASPDGGAGRPAAVLDGFLTHLLRLGAVKVCGTPERRITGWTTRSRLPDAAAGSYTDAYRRSSGHLDTRALPRVRRGLHVAGRLHAVLAGAAPPAAGRMLDLLDDHPRRVTELLAQHLGSASDDAEPDKGAGAPVGWRPVGPGDGDTPYTRLHAHLTARLDAESIDLDAALLDALGAGPAPLWPEPWPLDLLLRPLPAADRGPLAVLESASPGGVLDARLTAALEELHGPQPAAAAYRDHLARTEKALDARFVELLVPPLAATAANAVRRPRLTGLWTGDPDPRPYFGHRPRHARHLPLGDLTCRRTGAGTPVTESLDGQRLLPVHHATRSPLPPYDALCHLLLNTAPVGTRHTLTPGDPAAAWPDATRIPRLTLAGALVYSPTTWRVPHAALWPATASTTEKIHVLNRLRRRHRLPRHVFAATRPGGKPVPVDLESVTTFRALERLIAGDPAGRHLLLHETVPAPCGPTAPGSRPGDGSGGAAAGAGRGPSGGAVATPADTATALLLHLTPRPAGPMTTRAPVFLPGRTGEREEPTTPNQEGNPHP